MLEGQESKTKNERATTLTHEEMKESLEDINLYKDKNSLESAKVIDKEKIKHMRRSSNPVFEFDTS